jgi:hypothetical protein
LSAELDLHRRVALLSRDARDRSPGLLGPASAWRAAQRSGEVGAGAERFLSASAHRAQHAAGGISIADRPGQPFDQAAAEVFALKVPRRDPL